METRTDLWTRRTGETHTVPPRLRLASTGTLKYGLPVREVLGVSTLADAELVAGAAGLDRIVQRLNVMEVPDVLAWVKPNELLLTTGYPLRNRPEALGHLVTGLNERGVAALAVKPGAYLDELPKEMLARADRLGFPLIQLPEHVGFDDILNQVLTDILNRQAAILARTEEVHRALVQIVLCGGGLPEVTAELAELLDGAVLAMDGDERVLAGAGAPDDLKTLETWLDRHHGLGLHGDRVVVPVAAGGLDHGLIAAYFPGRELSDTEVGILERAATVAALVITKQQAVAAVESKYRADFLRDVLAGRAGDAERVVAHCAGFGWDLARPVAVLVAALDLDAEGGRPSDSAKHAQERLAAAWAAAVRRRDRDAAVAAFAHEVVAVVGLPDEGSLADLVAGLVREISTVEGVVFTTGVSRPAPDPALLPEAYDQAVKAVRVGRQLHGPGETAHFDALGVYRLLSLVDDTAELHAFVAETLGDLAGDADPEAADLRRTLQVLLETNLNVAETARRLHFHYNTLRYRIGKLERMLGPFTEDPHLQLNVNLALRVLRMRGI
ncbi:PucR family transcriptional regulator [Actinocorallia sp. A-T 12471]|uniref:PucR family transcriptional regulator n=1 Tax=Actinocorallia sp. A-T 12471 TaxID=3089813 RepID=UPI0029CCD183|nr:PucR family transcriptional regulator ligand-binding domain-containing protein [Actinocorallia sp. A-T 12471]MDX6743109.1 PucR family transcriptional regulator ligand-binding domain-containing protein [Actinocorallia sp. A-T 12471]